MNKSEWESIKESRAKVFEDPKQWDKALEKLSPKEMWVDAQHDQKMMLKEKFDNLSPAEKTSFILIMSFFIAGCIAFVLIEGGFVPIN